MPCDGYKAAEYRHNQARNQYVRYALERNKNDWAGATERERRLLIHEARTAIDECDEIMRKHRLGCPACRADNQI